MSKNIVTIAVFLSLMILSCIPNNKKPKVQVYEKVNESKVNEAQVYKKVNEAAKDNSVPKTQQEKLPVGVIRPVGDFDISVKDFIIKSKRMTIGKKEEYAITLLTIDNLLYMDFYYDGEFLDKKTDSGQKRFLVLFCDKEYISLYDENNSEVFTRRSDLINREFSDDFHVKATSVLRENGIIYSAGFLLENKFLRPWAVSGSGIGEKITYTSIKPVKYRGISWLYISNGFVDYEKPYLYGYNNRVKQIRVRQPGSDTFTDFELKDTQQLQKVDFRNIVGPDVHELEIEIMDIYKGSRFNDTCINLMFPVDR